MHVHVSGRYPTGGLRGNWKDCQHLPARRGVGLWLVGGLCEADYGRWNQVGGMGGIKGMNKVRRKLMDK